MAGEAPEPGDLSAKTTVTIDPEFPPEVGATVSSAGYVYVYDTRTRERSVVNRNMLPAQLLKKRDDGSLAFTTEKPSEPPVRGTLKCYLHEDDPNRQLYKTYGFSACRKSNLPSQLNRETHMQHRHKSEWATIERDRVEIDRLTEMDYRRAIIDLAASRLETASCETCGKEFTANSEGAVANKLRLHQKQHR